MNKFFPCILWIQKEQKDCLKSVAKKQDVFGIFIYWFWQEFDVCLLLWVLKDVWNLELSKVITTKLLVSKMKAKVEELSKFGLKAFPIGSGDKEGFTEGDTSVGNCTAASKSSFLQDLKTETTDSLMHSGELKNFSQNRQMCSHSR